MDNLNLDYRQSHLAPDKGHTYDASFRNLPYRKMVWDWEKDVLDTVITKWCKNREGLKYLDFACGTGRILEYLEHYMDESYGVDISDSMISMAKERIKRSKLFLCDLTRKNIFSNDYFDVITAFRFLLNAQQELRESALHNIREIIKKDGYFIFNIHMNKGCILEKEIRTYQRIRRIVDPYFNSLSIKETKLLLLESNFEIIEMYHFGVIPIYSDGHKFLLELINTFERILSHSPFFLPISRYVIYVCRPERF